MDAKAGAREQFATVQDNLIALSHRIHAHPELGFEGEKASTWIADMLNDREHVVREKGNLHDL